MMRAQCAKCDAIYAYGSEHKCSGVVIPLPVKPAAVVRKIIAKVEEKKKIAKDAKETRKAERGKVKAGFGATRTPSDDSAA